jgi:hypothetical protein
MGGVEVGEQYQIEIHFLLSLSLPLWLLSEFFPHSGLEEGRDGRDELSEGEEGSRKVGKGMAHLQEEMFIRSSSNDLSTLVLKGVFLLFGILLTLLHLQETDRGTQRQKEAETREWLTELVQRLLGEARGGIGQEREEKSRHIFTVAREGERRDMTEQRVKKGGKNKVHTSPMASSS